MTFKAIIHYHGSQEQMQEIFKSLSKYRADKTVKYLTAMGVTNDNLQDILQHEKTHNTASKAG